MGNEAPQPDAPAEKTSKPHRCNDRVEDVVQALFTLKFSEKIAPAWANFRRCMASEPGSEPKDPHLVITDPERYLDPTRMRRRRGPSPEETQPQK